MKKRILLLVNIILGVSLCAFSSLRDMTDVVRIAQQNIPVETHQPFSGMQYSDLPEVELVDSSSSYFIFNAQENFILVSSDDRFPAVLGYGKTKFDTTDIPPALAELLAQYDNELKYLDSTQQHLSLEMLGAVFTDEKFPLLETEWGQNQPYNNLVPEYQSNTRSASGCVATAMAQIMYYWKYPITGTSFHSYDWTSTTDGTYHATLTADFENTTYDWDNMLEKYKGITYTPEQANAVATLMYHCGVSVDMQYGASSGAYTSHVPVSLYTYFGYDPNYQQISKDMYKIDSFTTIVHDEIKQNRPVLVSGSNSTGGHAFICDGYDIYGYFHINWGWNGTSNGYYLLSGLTPAQQGIGGTGGDYNMNTRCYIGIQPFTSHSTPPYPQMLGDSLIIITDNNDSTIGRTDAFKLKLVKFANVGLHPYNGYYYIVLANEDNDILKTLSSQKGVRGLNPNYFFLAPTFNGLSIPQNVKKGTYHVFCVYKDENYDSLRLLFKYTDFYTTLYVTDDSIYIVPNNALPNIQLQSPLTFQHPDSIPFNGDTLFIKIKNYGSRFIGDISARIYDGTTLKGEYKMASGIRLPRGETLDTTLINTFRNNLEINKTYTMRLFSKRSTSSNWETVMPNEFNDVPFRIFGYNTILKDTICVGSDYVNNGFDISSDSTPLAGQTKQYVNVSHTTDETRDSVTLLLLYTNIPKSKSTYATICTGMTYRFKGNDYTTPSSRDNPHVVTSPQLTGCDSVYYLYLQINPPIERTINASICTGEVYSFHGVEYTEPTSDNPYVITVHTGDACDTIVNLYLTVREENDSSIYATIKKGNVYNFKGQYFSESTMDNPYEFRISFPNKCDSVYYLYLNVLQPFDSVVVANICSGETYNFYGREYRLTEDSIPHIIRQNSKSNAQPDTIFHLYVIKEIQEVNDVYATICQNRVFTFKGVEYSEPSVSMPYTVVVPQDKGCDSVYHLYLTVLPSYDSVIVGSVCRKGVYYFRGNFYQVADTGSTFYNIDVPGQTEEECDTIFRLALTVNSNIDTSIYVSVCRGEIFTFRGIQYSQATKTDKPHKLIVPAKTEEECDTTFYIHIDMDDANVTTIHKTICSGEVFSFRGMEYFLAKDDPYQITVPQTNGCDSLYLIYLTVKEPLVDTLHIRICQGETFKFKGVEYSKPKSKNKPYVIDVSNGGFCDSVYYLYLRVDTPSNDTIRAVICPGDYFEFRGIRYDRPNKLPYVITTHGEDVDNACDITYVLYLNYLASDTSQVILYWNQDNVTLPYQVDEHLTIQKNITSDTVIYVRNDKVGCGFIAYSILTGKGTDIFSVKKDILKIEFLDLLGRCIHYIDNPRTFMSLSEISSATDVFDKFKISNGIYILRIFFKDGSSIIYKKEINR